MKLIQWQVILAIIIIGNYVVDCHNRGEKNKDKTNKQKCKNTNNGRGKGKRRENDSDENQCSDNSGNDNSSMEIVTEVTPTTIVSPIMPAKLIVATEADVQPSESSTINFDSVIPESGPSIIQTGLAQPQPSENTVTEKADTGSADTEKANIDVTEPIEDLEVDTESTLDVVSTTYRIINFLHESTTKFRNDISDLKPNVINQQDSPITTEKIKPSAVPLQNPMTTSTFPTTTSKLTTTTIKQLNPIDDVNIKTTKPPKGRENCINCRGPPWKSSSTTTKKPTKSKTVKPTTRRSSQTSMRPNGGKPNQNLININQNKTKNTINSPSSQNHNAIIQPCNYINQHNYWYGIYLPNRINTSYRPANYFRSGQNYWYGLYFPNMRSIPAKGYHHIAATQKKLMGRR